MSSNLPKLRFPEFRDEWQIKRLGDVTSHFQSGSSITSSRIRDVGEFPVYGGNGLRGYTDTYTHDDFYLLIGRQGALCGNINRVNGKVYISEHAVAVKADETSDTEWLTQRLEYMNLNKLSESSAQPGLSVQKLVRIKIAVPSLQEQQKIAGFLTAVDEKIAALRRKKELLDQYKKGAMQAIFSQRIRFRDDSGNSYPDWEEKKLGQCLTIRHGRSQKEIETEGGRYPILATSGVIGRTNTPLHSQPSVLIGRKGTIDRPQYMDTPFWTVDTLFYTEISSNNSSKFLFYVFQTINWKEYNEGSGVPSLSAATISRIKLKLPSFTEQQKIADFLTSLDHRIEVEAKKLEQAQQFKKALLQQMFV